MCSCVMKPGHDRNECACPCHGPIHLRPSQEVASQPLREAGFDPDTPILPSWPLFNQGDLFVDTYDWYGGHRGEWPHTRVDHEVRKESRR